MGCAASTSTKLQQVGDGGLRQGFPRQALIGGAVKVAATLVGATGFPGADLLAQAMLTVSVKLAVSGMERPFTCMAGKSIMT